MGLILRNIFTKEMIKSLFPFFDEEVLRVNFDFESLQCEFSSSTQLVSEDSILEEIAQEVISKFGVNNNFLKLFNQVNQINSFVINTDNAQKNQLREVFPESDIYNSAYYDNTINNSVEILPWGVQAVWQGEDITKRGNFAIDSYAFVIDSGVLNTTGDINLSSNFDWHRSWVFNETPFTDGTGHGTHVAGTIGALVNGKGVIGVAPGAQIVSLKVFDSYGGGSASTTIIDAINYATSIINNNNLDKSKCVINLSLSGVFNSSIDAAIKNAADQGIQFSVAAGNNGQDADNYSPASAGDHQNVYTVSAVDSNYRMPFWSNWDILDSTDSVDDVDFAAPGVGVLSYHKNGQLAYLSGTSMAAPHLSGLLITGGVQAGTSVQGKGSDPFAISSTQTFIPLEVPPSSQELSTPPEPTYSLSSSTSINEGQTLRIEVTTTNVKPGSYVHWQISGNGIDLNDFVVLHNLWGGAQVNAEGKAFIDFALKNDNLTEGNEVIKFELFDEGHVAIRKKVGETSITIQDTSKTPVPVTPQFLWGTTENDVITGGSSNDRIAGVKEIGTAPSDLGRGQIDVLTGGLGADIFVLGDSRGVFYDDGISGNLGTSDYALIKDFQKGVDKLQLKNRESYTFESIGGNGYLYLNRNRTTTIEKWGPNQEELIAVLEGVSTLGNTDLFMV